MLKDQCERCFAGFAVLLAATLPFKAHAAAPQMAGYLPSFTADSPRITHPIENTKLVEAGIPPALATLKNDAGALPSTQTLRNVTVLLKRSDAKQTEFNAYIQALTNPSSPYFHHWLTPAQIGDMFGPAQADIGQVKNWLQGQGLRVTSVSPTGMMIHFSGTSAAISGAFHTSLHRYVVNGEVHFSNSGPLQLPAALATVVAGVSSLNNFFPKPQHVDVATVMKDKKTGRWSKVTSTNASHQFTVPGGTLDPNITYDVAPQDFNAIYNVAPLWNQSTPVRGAGQTVAVLERTDVLPADVRTFRSAFLPANALGNVSYIHPLQGAGDASCPDPGLNGDEGEAALDTEWAGAAAPDANIVFASCDDSQSPTFGPFTAAENLLSGYSGTIPSVFSLSYGECEVDGLLDGTVLNAAELWQQAAAQGVTVFVSSGDSGSAGCNDNQAAANFGISVNGMASTPFNVAVGGTDFNDFSNYSRYWTSTNLALGQSAVGYIPEMTWNDSCASSVVVGVLGYTDGVQACNSAVGQQLLTTRGGSGGPSSYWNLPLAQVGVYGATDEGTRTLPDVSLFAANGLFGHALVFCMSDATQSGTPCVYSNPDNVLYNSAGGTSFAAPAMAGVQALINQATGQSNGNMLPVLYNLGTKQYGTIGAPNTALISACNSSNGTAVSSACVFNNVTVGNNDAPCYGGTSDCFNSRSAQPFGVLSAGGFDSLDPAWNATPGYSMATGLGSVNVANLVNAVSRFYKPFKHGYVAPYDYLSLANTAQSDGYSDIAIVNSTTGSFMQLGMKGSVVLTNATQSSSPGYTIGSAGDFFAIDNPFNAGVLIADLAWTGPDHQLYVWLSDGFGGASSAGSNYYPAAVGTAYPTGWALIGSGNFDNVGSDELFWWDSNTNQVSWWQLNMAVVQIHFQNTYHFSTTKSPNISIPAGDVPHLADLNGDGYADLILTNPKNNTVLAWINNQKGGFVSQQIQSAPVGFQLFGAGDLAGNGVTTLFWTNPATNQLQLWTMNGYAVTSVKTLSVPAGYTMASIADFDGDGLADVLWVTPTGTMYEWLSDGSGGFTSQLVVDINGAPVLVPAGSAVQPNRLQGGMVTSGINTSAGVSH
ncbi:protease pro-enzyme activation domain-containing protein [Dyella sp. C11]|uniref:protease pro-enzyme activation domain-containing protein n=1 Tax=Dyella sp. C11 TaxID=2126991 RepID=UPI000D6510C4|nr:protease pro-enzyme activation domain-containing protein [Dyella sp. C11]